MDKKKQLFRLVKVLLLFALAFMAGRFGAMMTDGKQAVETAAGGGRVRCGEMSRRGSPRWPMLPPIT